MSAMGRKRTSVTASFAIYLVTAICDGPSFDHRFGDAEISWHRCIGRLGIQFAIAG